MNKHTLFEIDLFDPEHSLLALLEMRDIEFEKAPASRNSVVAMDETIIIVSNDSEENTIENLSLAFTQWITAKRHRKLQVQLLDGSILSIHEHDIEGVAKILKTALKITAFDPEYNTQILNSQKDPSLKQP